MQSKYIIYWIVFIAALSGLLFGFDTGVISGAILFVNQELQLTTFDTSLVTSAALFGACISAAVSGRVVDLCGRRHLLMFNAFLFFCGALSSALAPTVQLLIISRTIVGFAIGISSYVAPIYISELAPFRRRGIMVGFNQLFIVLGILIAYVVNYWFSFGENWRLMFGAGVIFALLLFIGLLFVPESPRWLVASGQENLAREILKLIRANTNNVELELFEIKENIREQRKDWKMLLKPWVLPAVVVGIGIAAFQQLVGINIFLYYGHTIFTFNGLGETSSIMLASLGMGVVLTIFTIIGLPLIDVWGRRPLLLLGAAGMVFGLLTLSLTFWLLPNNMDFFKWLLFIGTVIYIASFAISFGPIGWLMISEIFPLRIRGLATSLATATIWGVNMLVIFTFLPLVKLLQLKGVFLLYSGLCFLSLFFVYFMVPETRKITLEHIETNLRSGKKSRDLGE
ncbi:MAG: sugar porter family MFS transporter [Coxiellaceae bacterium]|jgi:sugar porter (SP) family MFS transporter|nr:sugar porter family MFS transporter [Coxiellaceae bacterium]